MITAPRPNLTPERRSSPSAPPGDRKPSAGRVYGFGVIIVLLFLALTSRLWFMQIAHGADYRQASDDNEARLIRTHAPRGIIVDCEGKLLAANRARCAVYITPDVLKNPTVLDRLATLLDESPQNIEGTVHNTEQNPYDPIRVALDVSLHTFTRVEEERYFLPGVSTELEPVRWYPQGTLAAQLLGTMGRITPDEYQQKQGQGYFSDDFVGQTGVEREYESYLHGTPGGTEVQINARGRKVKVVGTRAAIAGGTVTLALNAQVQAAAEAVFQQNHFIGAAVAMNPRTGAIQALVSSPTFSPNQFASGIKSADWKMLETNPHHPLLDRALDALYAPGSTFKPIVASAGLQTGAMTTQSTAYSPGYYYLGRARFGDWKACGFVNFYTAMAQSCDVFFYIYGQKIGPDRLSYFAKSFGLGQKTGIDMPGEYYGRIPSPAWKAHYYRRYGPAFTQWYGGDTLHMSIGQGDVLVTPLQMARVTATLANGGDVMQPYVVQKVTSATTGEVVYQSQRKVLRHVPVSAKNIAAVREAMRVTVTSGTGRIVDFPQVAVAGKTGSAQVHGQAMTNGWFICFAPYDHPTIAIAAVVERGGHGANTAGLVSRAMLQAYFHLKGGPGQTVRSD
jgi:penicillin-binding protein 2